MTEVPSRRQAIDLDLERRSSKIDNALENMLTSNERKKSRELSQALNQTKSKTIQDIEQPKPRPMMHVSQSLSSDAVVIGASEIVGSDSSKRRSRESASRIQNTIDIENNYRKWSTEYVSKSSSVNDDYAELGDEEGLNEFAKSKIVECNKSAQTHINPSSGHQPIQEQSDADNYPPKSKLAKLTGKSGVRKDRKSLLSRVGVKSRPTFDLIADGVLGSESSNYHPKVKLTDSQGDVSSLVAERIKNLRERTLSKISSETNIVEDSFFGFESDGTPIWSSVVSGARAIESRIHHEQLQPLEAMHHHSVHVPIVVAWPKQLQLTSHNTFKNWCVVSENKRATQLSEQVVDYTQQTLNPLIIIGDSGTGKSHLLNAIGQSTMLRSDHCIYFIRGDELSQVLSQEHSWTDIFSQSSMLLIDDIDMSLESADVSNALGTMIDAALNMNVHVVISSKSSPDSWPASKLWNLLRSGVKTIINPVGAGSLMLYARRLAMEKSIVLSDEQLALIVTSGDIGWRSTKNSVDKIESALNSGVQLIDSIDVYKVMNDIQSDEEETVTELQTESVEDIANRLISSVVDVVTATKNWAVLKLILHYRS